MKIILFLSVLFIFSSCCNSEFHDSVHVAIYKDNKPLYEQNIVTEFFYKDANGEEIPLHTSGALPAWYNINRSSELEKLFFKPTNVYIRYNNLPEIDTLEILLDYECKQGRNCHCPDIVLKYMKYNSVLLPDYTIHK